MRLTKEQGVELVFEMAGVKMITQQTVKLDKRGGAVVTVAE